MACSNCFNGCSEITSDKCVKYTGVDVPLLGIKNGDSLSYVEQTLIGFLSSTLDGTGIKPNIDPLIICNIVQSNLPDCGDLTVVDLITALIKSVCSLQEQVNSIYGTLNTLNGAYTIPPCLEVTPNAGTHAILQAVITQVCTLDTSFTAIVNDLLTNYVTTAELPALIQGYLDSIAVSGLLCNKMVPFTVVEYYGNLAGFPTPADGFGVSGAGYGAWLNVYLCNGNNGTPDKRGRVGVGDTVNMGGPVLDVDRAAYPYTKGVAQGTNTITLTPSQMPTHTHAAPAVVTDPGHYHFEFADTTADGTLTAVTYPSREKLSAGDSQYNIQGSATVATLAKTSNAVTNVTVGVTVANAGSSASHLNIQPGLGCYYIIYIP
jgi:microcystin-dependent protein